MVPLSPPLLIAAASTLIGTGAESETCRGRLLDLILAGVGQPNTGSWSAAFVHHVGYWSHYDFGGGYSSWPLPPTNDPRDLAAFGHERQIYAPEPEPGDVFLLWSSPRKQHARAGIVVQAIEAMTEPRTRRQYWVCLTIEGETTDTGAATGGRIQLVQRNLSVANRDRFLRWTALDTRELVANPAAAATLYAGRLRVLRRAA